MKIQAKFLGHVFEKLGGCNVGYEKRYSTYFFRKVVGFVERFFAAYHAGLYWVDKSPHVHCHVR
ncbi:MAG: hypothetical protein ACTSYM_07705, partial [Candidatus Baldrarchaeia archaeon]